MMFKILIIQRLYNLSDDQTEFQINDRMTFKRFIGIHQVDASWKKNNQTFYGYKNHIKIDELDKILYADIAYVGLNIEKLIREKSPEIELKLIEKAYKNKPLTDEQKQSNKIRSKTRVRVEHVFGFMTNSMNGITLRCIGKARADFNIAITNLIYNFCRYEFLKRPKKITG